MNELDVAILGSTGDTGEKLTQILGNHPNVIQLHVPSREELNEFEGSEVVVSALPNGESAPQVARFRDRGSTVIDMSGDLRFPTLQQYEKWYGSDKPHPAPRLLGEHVPYGLPEINRERLEPGIKLVSMPGCYATAIVLAMAPLHKHDMIEPGSVTTVSASSGESGRGKKAGNSDILRTDGTAYNQKQYRPGRQHQHVGEIERALSGQTILFKPSVVGIGQGIMANISMLLTPGVSAEDVTEAYHQTYDHEPFVKVLPEGQPLETAAVVGNHECHIGFTVLRNTVFATSALNNLLKGAASQAVQVFNLTQGLPEETGLNPKAGWPPKS